MRRQLCLRATCGAALAALVWMVLGQNAWAIQIEDTYTRADSTDLGVTEVGGYGYLELATTAAAIMDSAEILGGELYLHGTGGATSSNPGLALFDVSLASLSISSDIRFSFPNGINNTSSYNFSGFMLRRNGTTPNFTATNNGQVEVLMHAGGGFLVREIQGGSLSNLYADNPFGLGGSVNNVYSTAGQLPTEFNGMPFDANGNGILEDNEPFNLSANLMGNSLSIDVNGMEVINVNTAATTPLNFFSNAGLYKNRFTSGGTRDVLTPVYDNVVIDGTLWVPPPPPPILHVGDTDPVSEHWLASNFGTVASNGPVDDGGTPAWNIHDDAGGRAGWTRSLDPGQSAIANSKGWRYKANVRVLEMDDLPDGGIELSVFANSDVGYTLWLGSDVFGSTTISEFGGVLSGGLALGRTVELPGTGYHEYELLYNAVRQRADLYADGSLVLADVLPLDREGGTLNRVLWGSNASGGIGNANYSFVEFTLVPEPSACLLALLGACCLFRYHSNAKV